VKARHDVIKVEFVGCSESHWCIGTPKDGNCPIVGIDDEHD
jgi:hypothetical protein